MIDIVLAYFISTRIFMLYHKACDDIHTAPFLLPVTVSVNGNGHVPGTQSTRHKRPKDRLARGLWWYPVFNYCESDTIEYRIPVQNSFDLLRIIRQWLNKRT